MSIKQVQLRVQDLTLGMYVSGLDRPWSQTPFPLQGFNLKTPKDIETIKSYCSYVYIDVTKGRGPIRASDVISTITRREQEDPVTEYQAPSFQANTSLKRFDKGEEQQARVSPIEIRRGVYDKTVPVRMEAVRAERIVRELKGQLTLVTKQIAKGKPIDYPALKRASDHMVESVLRCPDAYTWLYRLRQKDSFSYEHTLRSTLWALQFARYAGMDKEQISILCMGCLLKDIGKVQLPTSLLRKLDRNHQEEAEYQKFVEYGVEALRQAGNVEPKVISVVRYHCEKMDGTGFPLGISGNKIPVLARIAGIATVYDAISNPRECQDPVAPSKAVSSLYNMRNAAFQEDLVVSFIQSVGLYPPGTVVELTSGDLGVVLEQDYKSRLTPTVAVLSTDEAVISENCIILDLRDQVECRKKLEEAGYSRIAGVSKLAIARDLEPTSYDIDFEKISLTFLETAVAEPQQGFFSNLKHRLLGN